jgi:hypothetical protein
MISQDNSTLSFGVACNYLQSFTRSLDYLADPAIEEKMICSLDCCIGNNTPLFIEEILGNKLSLYESIIGITGIELVREFDRQLEEAVYYDAEQGFSQKAQWKNFSKLCEQLSKHIKISIAR